MSNERIDLKQFEGMTEGPWVSEEWDEGKILGPISERHRNNHPVVAVVGDGWWGDMSPESDANKRAMAAVPELIAELKRCYEELDKANEEGEALWNVLDNWDICMDDYSMHDLYNNLDEKYVRDNEGRIILKELYSYTEEDGWQPKESASE